VAGYNKDMDTLNSLNSLVISVLDTHRGFEIHEQEIFGHLFFNVVFDNRANFDHFKKFLDGHWGSDLEDDHNVFDLNPFLVDINHSDMIIKLSETRISDTHDLRV
jgi:hypothetical protein